MYSVQQFPLNRNFILIPQIFFGWLKVLKNVKTHKPLLPGFPRSHPLLSRMSSSGVSKIKRTFCSKPWKKQQLLSGLRCQFPTVHIYLPGLGSWVGFTEHRRISCNLLLTFQPLAWLALQLLNLTKLHYNKQKCIS